MVTIWDIVVMIYCYSRCWGGLYVYAEGYINHQLKMSFCLCDKTNRGLRYVVLGGATPLIYTRDTRLLIPPRVMAWSAMGLNLGDFRFLPTTQKQTQNRCVHDLHAPRSILCVFCLHVHTAVHTSNMHLKNHDYFDYGKNLKTPKSGPMQGSRWRRFWYLWCISVGYAQEDTSADYLWYHMLVKLIFNWRLMHLPILRIASTKSQL